MMMMGGARRRAGLAAAEADVFRAVLEDVQLVKSAGVADEHVEVAVAIVVAPRDGARVCAALHDGDAAERCEGAAAVVAMQLVGAE